MKRIKERILQILREIEEIKASNMQLSRELDEDGPLEERHDKVFEYNHNRIDALEAELEQLRWLR